MKVQKIMKQIILIAPQIAPKY